MPTQPTHIAYLSLGANIGEREQTIADALGAIGATDGITLDRVSSMYETEPVGYHDQPEFINCAASIATTLTPDLLLEALRTIERSLGRIERTKWRERELDIDILLMDDLIIESERLTIPHPQMHLRRFVLVPLVEIAPEARHPVFKTTARELLEVCPDRSAVERVGRG